MKNNQHSSTVRRKRTNKKNPLYVVTQKGKVVEEAHGPLDMLIKRFGLAPVLNVLKNIWTMLLEQVQSYAALEVFTKWLDSTVKDIEKLLKKFVPFAFFYAK